MKVVIKNYLTAQEINEIRDWLLDAYKRRIESPNRTPTDPFGWGNKSFIRESLGSKVEMPLQLPLALKNIQRKIIREFSFYQYDLAGNLYNYLPESRTIKPHSHKAINGMAEIRFNCLIQSSDRGGELVVDERIYSAKTGDLMIFNANLLHWVNPVWGDTPRLMVSFGWQIPIEKAQKICPNYATLDRETIYKNLQLEKSPIKYECDLYERFFEDFDKESILKPSPPIKFI